LNETKIKYQCFRKAFSRHYDIAYFALKQWKKFAGYKNAIVKRIFVQLDILHKYRLNDSFQIWKGVVSKARLQELQKSNTEIVLENEMIARDIKRVSDKHKLLASLAINIRYLKLQRCMHATIRRFQRKSLRQWYKYYEYLLNNEAGAEILFRLENKHFLRVNIEKWKLAVREQRRIQYITNFLENSERYKSITTKTRIFE